MQEYHISTHLIIYFRYVQKDLNPGIMRMIQLRHHKNGMDANAIATTFRYRLTPLIFEIFLHVMFNWSRGNRWLVMGSLFLSNLMILKCVTPYLERTTLRVVVISSSVWYFLFEDSNQRWSGSWTLSTTGGWARMPLVGQGENNTRAGVVIFLMWCILMMMWN